MTQAIRRLLFVFCFICLLLLFDVESGGVEEAIDGYYSIKNNPDEYLDNLIVEPVEIRKSKHGRSKRFADYEPYERVVNNFVNSPDKIVVKVEEWVFVLEENKYISFGKNFEEIWSYEDEPKKEANDGDCKFYTGSVLYEPDSQVTLTICAGKFYYGFFNSNGKSFIIEPIDEPFQSHIIYKAKLSNEKTKEDANIANKESPNEVHGGSNSDDVEESPNEVHDESNSNDVDNEIIKRLRRELKDSEQVFDLTGDTAMDDNNYNFASEDTVTTPIRNNPIDPYEDEEEYGINSSYDYYDYDLPPRPKLSKGKNNEEDAEEIGYFIDTPWLTRPLTKSLDKSPEKVERWLEIALAVDYTVINFHGKEKVKRYVMALMNIVSSIYKDKFLDARLHLVMARLLFYSEKKDSVIREGNAKKSLEDVNRWNYKLIGRLPRHENPHDVAVWLTREYLGGPSGYAPVAGVCDRARSTALNKDEGLASAFIIAHEMAHVLGLTHDGDLKAGNKCEDEVFKGTIMAPTVSANTHRFTWSSCSKEEFHRLVRQWHCLLNPPEGVNHTIITPGTTEYFTMDEQCRMEYGEGYGLCRSFELIEPCRYLWCGQKDSMQCITKKGAPAEGTQCGFDKWCVNGFCQKVDKRLLYGTGVPRDGGWGNWSQWSECSRSCGYGVKIRRRSCDNPSPDWSGAECKGPSEEKKICQQERQCWEAPPSDPRADKCNLFPKEGKRNGTWIPFESENEEDCRVSCMLWETGEVVRSTEFVPDGTPCTYDNPHHICIEGRCKRLGCDGVEGSPAADDECGVCEGYGDSCFESRLVFNKVQKKNMTRLLVLPRNSRNIRLRVAPRLAKENNRILPYALFHLTLRNKRKKLFKIDARNENDVMDIKSGSEYLSSIGSNYQVGPTIVIAGSAFVAGRPPGMLSLTSKGPLHSDVVILLNSPSEYLYSVESHVEANYTLDKKDVGRYRWLLEEHIPCQCGEVPRPHPIYCIDTRRGNRVVHGSHCSRAIKPRARPQTCNSCDFHWIPGPWEYCTTSCGRNGTSHRQLYCVPKSFEMDTPVLKLIKFMVEPKYCDDNLKPIQEQPCKTFACPAYWEEGPWTKCSSSCGLGNSTRTMICDSPITEECGEMPPTIWKTCRSKCPLRHKPELADCKEDKSRFCTLPLFYRYCVIPSFRKLCCDTCKRILYKHKNSLN